MLSVASEDSVGPLVAEDGGAGIAVGAHDAVTVAGVVAGLHVGAAEDLPLAGVLRLELQGPSQDSPHDSAQEPSQPSQGRPQERSHEPSQAPRSIRVGRVARAVMEHTGIN